MSGGGGPSSARALVAAARAAAASEAPLRLRSLLSAALPRPRSCRRSLASETTSTPPSPIVTPRSRSAAITHHRKRRGKRALHSALDDIPGVGPALKKALIQHFGTVAEIRAAEPAKLAEVKGVGPALAQRIHDALREH